MSVRKRRWITNKGEAKEAWIVDYVDQAGDRHIQTFARKKEADDHWATVKVEVRKGVRIAPSKSPTAAEAADRWLREVQARNIEASTLARYRTHVNLHIVPAIGAVKLTTLTQERIEGFRDELLKKLSRPLARKVLTSLKSLLKVSRYSHVAVGVSIKRGRNEKRRIEAGRDFPTIAEIGRLLAAANDDTKQRALLLILAFTGLRASEFRGLCWSDIDLKECELHVRQRADEYNVIGAPKSDASVRTIPIDPDVMAPALKEWKLKCPPSDFVFPTRTGKPQDYNGIRDGSIDPAMRAAKLIGKDGEPKYTPHALRHFFAS
jgi:integrase